MQPATESQASTVQGLLSLQLSVDAPGWQTPPPQTSPTVQALPSLHAAVLLTLKQLPVWESQASVVHGLLSEQDLADPAQTPLEHLSLMVQGFPSSQELLLKTKPQPLAALHTGVVQGFESSGQVIAEPVHTPLLQASPVVQTLLSLQVVPLVTLA